MPPRGSRKRRRRLGAYCRFSCRKPSRPDLGGSVRPEQRHRSRVLYQFLHIARIACLEAETRAGVSCVQATTCRDVVKSEAVWLGLQRTYPTNRWTDVRLHLVQSSRPPVPVLQRLPQASDCGVVDRERPPKDLSCLQSRYVRECCSSRKMEESNLCACAPPVFEAGVPPLRLHLPSLLPVKSFGSKSMISACRSCSARLIISDTLSQVSPPLPQPKAGMVTSTSPCLAK